jgi:hypothetical protein
MNLMTDLSTYTKSSTPIQLAEKGTAISALFKTLNYQDFCSLQKDVIKQTMDL